MVTYKPRTLSELATRIVFRQERLERIREKFDNEFVLNFEQEIINDMLSQYRRRMIDLHRCLGINLTN